MNRENHESTTHAPGIEWTDRAFGDLILWQNEFTGLSPMAREPSFIRWFIFWARLDRAVTRFVNAVKVTA